MQVFCSTISNSISTSREEKLPNTAKDVLHIRYPTSDIPIIRQTTSSTISECETCKVGVVLRAHVAPTVLPYQELPSVGKCRRIGVESQICDFGWGHSSLRVSGCVVPTQKNLGETVKSVLKKFLDTCNASGFAFRGELNRKRILK